ncbi:MAG: hypothetical protein DRQ55_13055 [Planctomycetota bacterium]|nr:MAG: hypothetical protein DRQ55_13055 [Planctomycetota bacterium]
MQTRIRRRRSEQGSSILMAMLVFMVLLVVIYQVFFGSQVELDRAAQAVTARRMRWLADAARIQASSVLLVDLEDASAEDEEGGGGDAGGGLGGLGGGGEGGGGATDVIGNTDSLLDEWMNSAALAPALGEGLTIHVEVIDEDSKINLLGLWAEDEERREDWREVFERLLDKAFEGTSLDLSGFDAADLLDDLDNWVVGDRSDLFDRRDPPTLKRTDAQDTEASEVDTDIIENDEVQFPMTLSELLLLEGLVPEQLEGFVEDDVFYPGLREYLTVWTHLELKRPPPENDEFSDSPMASAFDDEAGDEAAEEPAIDTASTTNNGLINCNTAPLLVLRALAPEDIPSAYLERVIEFRNRVRELTDELAELGEEQDDFGQDANSQDPDQLDEGQEEDELDEDDPAFYVFQEPSEIFSKVEDQWDLSVFTEDSEKDEFVGRLSVTSDVFTIKINIFDPLSGRRGSYRCVVWRIADEEQPLIVPLMPLEEYVDARRPEDFPEDFEQASDDRFERPFDRR